ncbi:MAG: methyltransferase domain-containing protein [Gemmatimonadota bacterium]
MRLGERILLGLSRESDAPDYEAATDSWTAERALVPLRREFPDLTDLIHDARVVDFGCGTGWQSIALVKTGARMVLGVDTNERTLGKARELAGAHGVADRIAFDAAIPEDQQGSFDIVITLNAMEHFDQPESIMKTMASALRRGGRLLVSFGPPWLAPTGSHMHFFTRVPWVNLFFSERTVMAVRSRFRSDGARRYEEVESGLNRMTVRRFERIAAQCGLHIERKNYRCVKGLDFLQWTPGLREFFINNVSCVLTKR